jgi:hypothetical protein
MSKEANILKSDAGGHVLVLVPVDRQLELVREFGRSGLSGPRFAEIAGVKFQTFAAWPFLNTLADFPAHFREFVAPKP